MCSVAGLWPAQACLPPSIHPSMHGANVYGVSQACSGPSMEEEWKRVSLAPEVLVPRWRWVASLHRRLGKSLMRCSGPSPSTGSHLHGRPPPHGAQTVGSEEGTQGVAVLCSESGLEAKQGGWVEGEITGLPSPHPPPTQRNGMPA